MGGKPGKSKSKASAKPTDPLPHWKGVWGISLSSSDWSGTTLSKIPFDLFPLVESYLDRGLLKDSYTVKSRLPVPETPNSHSFLQGGMALDKSGRLFVAEHGAIHIWNKDGKYEQAFGPKTSFEGSPIAFTLDNEDNLVILNLTSARVEIYSPSLQLRTITGKLFDLDSTLSLSSQTGLVTDPGNCLWVSDFNRNLVVLTHRDGIKRTIGGGPDQYLSLPTALGIDHRSGHLYVAECWGLGAKQVSIWDLASGERIRAIPLEEAPLSVVVDKNGDFAVSIGSDEFSTHHGKILLYSKEGELRKELELPSERYSPNVVCMDRHGNLFVTNRLTMEIHVFG